MNWFEGEIAEAITISKQKQAIFVVYIHGKDEKSLQITQVLDQSEVAQILGGASFVAIKIEADGVSYQQFSQIYKQVPVPSIYFIGKQGVPLEIVTEANDAISFKEKLNQILQKGGMQPISVNTENFISNESGSAETQTVPDNVVCENGVCTIKKEEGAGVSPEKKTEETEKAREEKVESPAKVALSVEEKVERAKELVEKKRDEKEKEESEKERQKEIERRKMGQNVQQLKRWQDDQELKNLMEEREKEKRESQAARERVLAQIAQDKAERAAKFSPPQPPQPQQSTSASPPKPVSSNSARLQFRMPDGRTATNDFSSSETLNSVHTYIRGNLNLPFSAYTLSTTFPRREFTESDKSQTLLELGLAPTAVILILPLNRGTIGTNASGGLPGIFWTLLSPVFTILGYLKTFIFGTAPANNTGNGGQNKRSAETNTDPRSQSPKVPRSGETTVIRRQGNIHRLSNRNDSDEDNNTWNGNSTQQM